MNIFERASRAKLRFDSPVGELTTEQLWDLPLTAKAGKANLDQLARGTNADLKDVTEGSFVDERPDPRKTELELKLDILKHVIASKIADRAAAEKAAQTAERKRKLMDALAQREMSDLAGMSREQIEKEIADLGT